MSALDQVVAAMVAEYATNPIQTQATVALVKLASKPRAKTPKEPKAPSDNGSKSLPMPIMTMVAGDLDATAFLIAFRRAKDRDQQIQAIQGYSGYDPKGDYATQEWLAKSKAQRELRGIDNTGPSRTERRQAMASVKGFVAGIPDGMQRQIGNLLGRESMAAEAIAGHCKAATEQGCINHDGDGSCCTHHAKAEVEKTRLSHIRKDLNALK